MKIILFANTDWFLYNFRLPLARALHERGAEVVLASPKGAYSQLLVSEGFRWIELPMTRDGMNPFRELATIRLIYKLYQREQPDLVHHFTIKYVLYGSLAARFAGIKSVVNTIPGLGYVFTGEGILKSILRVIVHNWYRLALRGSFVTFDNTDDREYFLEERLVRPENSCVVRGAGVDTENFTPLPEPDGIPVILQAGRMLVEKGVGEFAGAAGMIKHEGLPCRFVLVGRVDPGNPASIQETQLSAWQQEGLLEWWGWQENIHSAIAQAHIVCHPSYREGLPTILLEAAACARPIVTTDTAGCRDAVVDGETGILVPVKDVDALARALRSLITDPALRQEMGIAGRRRAEAEFSVGRVIMDTLHVYRQAGAKGL